MTTLVRLALALFLALFASSCVFDMSLVEGKRGNGNVVEDLREVDGEFTELTASEGIAVYLTQGPEYEIRVEGDENIIDLIGTRIRNGELKVYAIENIGKATKNVYVRMPEVRLLESSSGADLVSEGTIKAETLELQASSGSMQRLELNANELTAGASSGANMNLSGTAVNMDVDASSGANINARDLDLKTCKAEASSGSNIRLHVAGELTAQANSGANISYRGEAVVHKNKSFSGNIYKD